MVFIDILPPKSSEEYKCVIYVDTAHSVFVNKNIIDKSNCEDIFILSCDHVYNMDYFKLYKQHKDSGADLTVMVTQVPMKEASRFGIFSVDENGELTFEEKPKNPKSNLASTGVYILKKINYFHSLKNIFIKKITTLILGTTSSQNS